jgi:hypothetical protein
MAFRRFVGLAHANLATPYSHMRNIRKREICSGQFVHRDGQTTQINYGSICLPQCFKNGAIVSIGMGKMVVEFFSAAISTNVCR